ncbi:MAG: pyridoxal phosphate-dependent aminotransferase [Chthoniobacteraceae bacterium]
MRAAVAVAKKYDLLILSDEIYEPFLYDGKPDVYSPLSLYENTVVLRGFSKSHAMTGWRVGYVYGQPEVVAQMTKLQQYTFVCAPSPFQDAALAALDVDMSGHVNAYTAKRDLVFNQLKDKFEIVRPGGAFYVFPKAPAGQTASAFVEKAIANNVLIIPGNVFSKQDTHFRISYATTDEKARPRLRRAARSRRASAVECELAGATVRYAVPCWPERRHGTAYRTVAPGLRPTFIAERNSRPARVISRAGCHIGARRRLTRPSR